MEQRRSNNGADYFLLLVADFRNVHVNIISSQVVGGLEPRQGPLVFSELCFSDHQKPLTCWVHPVCTGQWQPHKTQTRLQRFYFVLNKC